MASVSPVSWVNSSVHLLRRPGLRPATFAPVLNAATSFESVMSRARAEHRGVQLRRSDAQRGTLDVKQLFAASFFVVSLRPTSQTKQPFQDQPMTTSLHVDVVSFIVSNFGVIADRANWGIAGWSMGGTCAR
ncbi:membrane protein [Mycobacterium lepromatosis]|nr:membrane protein [Mycobacterium lepromatosis]